MAVIAIVLVLALIGVAIAIRSKSNSSGNPGSEIFLTAASDSGANPFTASVAAPQPTSTIPLGEPIALGPSVSAPRLGTATSTGSGSIVVAAQSGGTPGLYGGTRDVHSCNPEQMISFLEAQPDKLRAWADAEQIDPAEVGSFIRDLTPVLLRSDTRVTNYGYSDGQATPHQAILQAGTAVLVDHYGIPRAKCNCGNPLQPPKAIATTPRYLGPRWTGFSPSALTVIMPSPTVVNVFVVIDVQTGTPFARDPGANGHDHAAPKLTPGGGTSSSSSSDTSSSSDSGSSSDSSSSMSDTNSSSSSSDSSSSSSDSSSSSSSGSAGTGSLDGNYTMIYPPSADGTCSDPPPATLTITGPNSSIHVTATSTQFTDQLSGEMGDSGAFSVHGTRDVGGGLGMQMTGTLAPAGSDPAITDGQLTFNSSLGPCTFSFTASRQ